MVDIFEGAGAPPPPGERKNKHNDKFPRYGFEEMVTITTKKEQKQIQVPRRIFSFSVKPGEKGRRMLILDYMDKRHAVYVHRFIANDGKFGSVLASPFRSEPGKGDPMNDALDQEPTWYWALTGIDLDPPPNKSGKSYPNTRSLVLVTDRQRSYFQSMEKMGGGLRGKVFEVSRSDDSKSYRIGTDWDPQDTMTQDEMLDTFVEAASKYGIPVERFIEPFDYPTVFQPKTHEELKQIADSIVAGKEVRDNMKVAGEGDGGSIKF